MSYVTEINDFNNRILPYLTTYKKTHDEDSLSKLLEIFNPLICKYSRKLSDEYKSDFIILCIECFNKIPLLSDPFIINYISRACHNKYINLSKKRDIENSKVISLESSISYVPSSIDSYLSLDMKEMTSILSPLEYKVIYYKFLHDLTDQEIAAHLSISRQYVQKIKKRSLIKLRTHYI